MTRPLLFVVVIRLHAWHIASTVALLMLPGDRLVTASGTLNNARG
jgi:hypothetical protein